MIWEMFNLKPAMIIKLQYYYIFDTYIELNDCNMKGSLIQPKTQKIENLKLCGAL